MIINGREYKTDRGQIPGPFYYRSLSDIIVSGAEPETSYMIFMNDVNDRAAKKQGEV